MMWIYSIIVTLFAILTIVTTIATGELQTLFLGLEIGVLIGQIIYFIDEIRRCK